MTHKPSKIDSQLFGKTILTYISYTNLLLFQCKMRLRVQGILKTNHSYNNNILLWVIVKFITWNSAVQASCKFPTDFTFLSIFPTLIVKNKLIYIQDYYCQINFTVHFITSWGSSKMFLELLFFKTRQLERKKLGYTSIYMYSAGHLKVLLIFFTFI